MTRITRRPAKAALWLCLLAHPLVAAELALPQGARQTLVQSSDLDSYPVPIGPWADGVLPIQQVEGRITREAWRIEGQGATTLQLLAPLRDQLQTDGWEILLDCADIGCGGFDFRFGTRVLPAPEMYVDIGNYRFLSAQSPDSQSYLTLLISRSARASFVQIIRVTGAGATPLSVETVTAPTALPSAMADGAFRQQLVTRGHVILGDLAFDSGASDLGSGPFETLSGLAAFLRANPDRRVLLVGHTDAVGTLEGNVALSRRRAQSVQQRLISAHGAAAAQIDAQGAGYLSPVASNDSATGRETNRRVEVVLLPQ